MSFTRPLFRRAAAVAGSIFFPIPSKRRFSFQNPKVHARFSQKKPLTDSFTAPPHRGQEPSRSPPDGKSVSAPGMGRYVSISSRSMASIPPMKSSGDRSPRSISFRRCSHSAVREGDCNSSGNTAMRFFPISVGTNAVVFCAFFRSANPSRISFSRTAARVAGVPRPRLSASFGISFDPAFSMAARRVSSVYRFGGVVFDSFTSALLTARVCPFSSAGKTSSKSFFRASRSFIHPGSVTVFPFAVNVCPAHSSRTVVSS